MIYAIVGVLVLLVDQFMKFWTVSHVELNTGIQPLIPGVVHLTHIKNFGAAFGLLLGKILHRFVMESVNLDYMSYDVRIAGISYVLSFVITLTFALLTNLFMRGKLEKVNMAESLKSVE